MRKAVVTGGSSGIGEQIVSLLKSKGYKVFSFGSCDGDLRYDRAPILKAIDDHLPDLVVNCAGIGLYGNAVDLSYREQHDVLEVNGTAVMEITLHAARQFKNHDKQGIILNVSSIAGEMPTPGMSIYGASKAFVSRLSQALDYELKPFGIRVLVSAPGMVRTPFMHRAAKKEVTACRGMSIDPKKAAKLIVDQIERKISFRVIDNRFRILSWLYPFLPKKTLMKTIYQSIFARL
ncbi:MAG: hypothetical protein S4CHLAM45_05110 [Chlamydiales bacterium]|nr:hypothetical protein [Chlamydiales bacterium]MCH9619948.1 hypothetical protein [Chlamydiales bacterium]MCH9622625.1 hypothetical protein [Chlamydiales bacterium]